MVDPASGRLFVASRTESQLENDHTPTATRPADRPGAGAWSLPPLRNAYLTTSVMDIAAPWIVQ